MKTVTEINAERIEAIIRRYVCSMPVDDDGNVSLYTQCARKIVEAFPELQQRAFTMTQRERVPFVVDDDR